jgi:hypothetical protein
VVATSPRAVHQRHVELEPAFDERQALNVEAHVGVLAVPIPPEVAEVSLRPAEQRAGDIPQFDCQPRRIDRLPVLHLEPKNDVITGHEVLADLSRSVLQADIAHSRFAGTPFLQPGGALGRIILARQQLLVAADRLPRLPVVLDETLPEENPPVAHALERRARVGNECDRLALPLELENPVDALALEGFVPNGKHLVEQQNLGIHVDGDREPEAHVHASGVRSDGQVDEALKLAELDDRVEPTVDLLLAQAVDRRAQVDVVAASEVRVEAGAELQQRANLSGNGESAACRLEDASEQP